ncbi:MAG: NAD-dependent epimerase/dehydratase family protein [Thermoplasmata archaeon]
MKNKRIFITGGAGFIGSNLVDKLVNENEIVIYDNLSSGHKEWILDKKAKFIHGDILDFENLKNSMKNIDVVIHLAANPDVRLGEKNNKIDLEVNVIGTYNVLESMRTNDVKNIIFSSSSTVYGEAPVPTPETYGPTKPISFYGASKLAAESYISAFSEMYGIKGVSYRFANVVGRHGTHGVIYDFIKKLMNDRTKLEVLGDGTQTKSYLHVEDCIDGILYLFDKVNKYDVFNLGTDGYTNVLDIARMVVEILNLKGVNIYTTGGKDGRGWAGDIKVMLLSIEKAKSYGWKPKYNSDEAVKKAIYELSGELGWKY